MVSVCLPSDALSQHLLYYLGSLTLDKGYLLTANPPDLEGGVAPLGPPTPAQPPLGCGVAPFKVRRGNCEEIPLVQGKEQQLHFAGAAMKRYLTSQVRGTQVRW